MKVPVGISQCLLGDPVRYNGKAKYDHYLIEQLREIITFHPVCPEMAIGLGVPRAPIQLVVTDTVRLKGVENPYTDLTLTMQRQAELDSKSLTHLCGYIVMQGSPSCGSGKVRRFNEAGELLDERGQGLYIATLKQHLPWLPIEESHDLHDNALLDNFLTRIFTLFDWQQSMGNAVTAKTVIHFHSRYKYLLMAHNPHAYRQIGRSLADFSGENIESKALKYIETLLQALRRKTGRGGHANVLMHLKGYFREVLSPNESALVDQKIADYRSEKLPLSEPLGYLHNLIGRTGEDYLAQQRYWNPYPDLSGVRDSVP